MKLKEILEKYRVGIVNYRIKSLRFSQDKAISQIRKALEKEIDNMEFPTSPEIQMYSFNKGVEKVVEIIKSFCEEE